MSEIREITKGLRFPEGPIAMPDGSVILVEIAAGQLTRVLPDGTKQTVAKLGGGPNGAAIGPDGKCYICNNGGFTWMEEDGLLRPGGTPDDYATGRIERIDLDTGAVETLYTECNGNNLRGPNDIVFDGKGGFWFTDLGKRRPRDMDMGGIYYARTDGSLIVEAAYPAVTPNGIGLSPDDKILYAAETETSRLWAWDIIGEGQLKKEPWPSVNGGRCIAGVEGFQRFDSLALDGAGNICVATLVNGGITVISPDGKDIEHIPMPDRMCTNICFGGPDLRTAYMTLSTTGKLVSMEWPRPGLPLHHLNK